MSYRYIKNWADAESILRYNGGDNIILKLSVWPSQALNAKEVINLLIPHLIFFNGGISFKDISYLLQNSKCTAYIIRYASSIRTNDWEICRVLTDLQILLQILLLNDSAINRVGDMLIINQLGIIWV